MRGRGKILAKDKIERSSALAQRQMLLFDEVGGEQSTVAWPSDAVRRLFKAIHRSTVLRGRASLIQIQRTRVKDP
jgi:hypothetical protein